MFLKTWRGKKLIQLLIRVYFGDRIKHWTGIPRRHLALLFVTRGGALRSDLWSGDQAGEGPTDCWRLHSPPSCRSHRGNLHTKLHILNGQHHGQNFLSIWSLSQVANLGILTRYLSNKTIWPFFPPHFEDFVQIWLYCKVADLRIAEVRMQRVVKLRLAPSPSLKDKYFYSHCSWWGQETVGPNHLFYKISWP